MKPPLHPLEDERLRELRRYGILDTDFERDFDDLVEIARDICEVPVAVVNFIDEGRQWFKAEVGLGIRSTPLETSLCGHAILAGDFVEIPDTLADRRMADNPLCTGEPGFRFYAGAILKGASGLPIGTICVLDHKPRSLTEHQRKVLRVLSRHVMRELDLRLALEQEQTLRREVDHRVKNSLASIGAMFSMKARRESNEKVREALEDAGNRIRSLSSLHAELHELAQGELVNLVSLFGRVQRDLRQIVPDGVGLAITVSKERAPPGVASALLLMVNEFVSNSVKHGLRDSVGKIEIDISETPSGWALTCSDNGTATAAEAERAKSATGLGTRVIQSLARAHDARLSWHADGSGMRLLVET